MVKNYCRGKKRLGGLTPSCQSDLRRGVQDIQLAVFESVLRGALTLPLPLQEPPLGIYRETWEDKARVWMQPMIQAAYSASLIAVRSAIQSIGPLSPMMTYYAEAARSHQAKKAAVSRKAAKGGRPATVWWRQEAKALWDKNSLMTASDMLERLERRGVVQCDAGNVVFLDDHGLRSDKQQDKKKFLSALNVLKNQYLGDC
jgi:hypothetical protein